SEHLKHANIDFINILYYENYHDTYQKYDYDLTLQKLIAKGKNIVVSEKFYNKFDLSLNDKNCLIISESNLLAETIFNIYNNNNNSSTKINHLRIFANSNYSIISVCNKLYDIYDNIKIKKNDNQIITINT